MTNTGGGGDDETATAGVRLHHAGLATDDAAAMVGLYTALFSCSVAHEETFDGMAVHFLALENRFLEVLEPHDGGPIADYLDEHGPGIHHLAFETPDIDAALDRARDCGVEIVDETPRPGAWGHEVAFLHPGSTGGVLVEFVETE